MEGGGAKPTVATVEASRVCRRLSHGRAAQDAGMSRLQGAEARVSHGRDTRGDGGKQRRSFLPDVTLVPARGGAAVASRSFQESPHLKSQ